MKMVALGLVIGGLAALGYWQVSPDVARPADMVIWEKFEAPVAQSTADVFPDAVMPVSGPTGVAVMTADRGIVYAANGDESFPLVSVAKIPIMLTVLQRAIDQESAITEEEYVLLEAMIAVSDNDAANALWTAIGDGPAVEAYLGTLGLLGFVVDPDGGWGDMQATPVAVGQLLMMPVTGEILDDVHRTFAIDLMSNVATDQRWGVMTGLWETAAPDTRIGVKDVWYPTEAGWLVNSAGFLIPAGKPAAGIVVLSSEQPTLEDGIAAIEAIAAYVFEALERPVLRPFTRLRLVPTPRPAEFPFPANETAASSDEPSALVEAPVPEGGELEAQSEEPLALNMPPDADDDGESL